MRSGINNNSVWSFWNLLSYCWGEDPSKLLKELEESGYDLQHAREELQNNKMVVLEAVKKRGSNLEFASEELKTDREFVLEAVKKNGWALQFANEQLRGDREVVLEAVRQNGAALQFASEQLRGDREVVLEAVNQHGRALEYADKKLMGDRELILEAVKKRGFNLQFASEELKTDREVVLMAVKENVAALQFASEQLRGDREFVLEAVKENGAALQFASEELKLEFKRIQPLFLFHDKIKAIMDEKNATMDEKNATEKAKIKRINEIIHGSTEQLEQMPFIRASDALRYLEESTKGEGVAIDQRIEDFCKKHPNKSPAILAYLATLYLVFIERIDYEHIDPEATSEDGFAHFTKKLFAQYQKEKTPNAHIQKSGAGAASKSSDAQISGIQ